MFSYKNRSVGFQLQLVISFCLLIAFSAIGVMAYQSASQVLLDKTLNDHQHRVEALATVLEGEFETLLDSAMKLESAFRNSYLSGIYMEESQVEFMGLHIFNITYLGESLMGDTKVVDAFTNDTDAVATLFAVTKDSDFVRIATSLKDQSGNRVIGTLLGKNHPGYKQLKNGQPYYARVDLFGEAYITYYQPIIASDGLSAGITFIGLPVNKAEKQIFAKLADMKWGDTGFTTIVSNSSKNRGQYLLHSEKSPTDSPIQEQVDAQDDKVFEALFQTDNGVVLYHSNDQGQTGNKYLAFAKVSGWDWKLAGAAMFQRLLKKVLLY